MPSGLLTMSTKEIERLTLIRDVSEKRLKQREAMKLLGLSKRQVIRLVKKYRRDGAQGLVSKHRGKGSNNRHAALHKKKIKLLVHKHYADFGPTLAAEKLRERDKLLVNKETLRQWMVEWELWQSRRQKQAKINQSRERRSCFGELIQLDGSHHDWFEGRREKCCLLVLIDDATSRLVGLRFEEEETTAGYFSVVREYIEKEGRPLAFYSDKYSVFRINHPKADSNSQTQFARAMEELGIEIICANSPQAKGRVERANGTLQDRLIKELRLLGINTIEGANAYLPTFIVEHNARFGVIAKSEINAHRKTLPDQKTLDSIFSVQETRTLSKNLEIRYKNRVYQIQNEGKGYRLRHAKITVCESIAGEICLRYKGRELGYNHYEKQKQPAEIIESKQLHTKLDQIKKPHEKYVPPEDHPWRRYVINPKKFELINEIKNNNCQQGG